MDTDVVMGIKGAVLDSSVTTSGPPVSPRQPKPSYTEADNFYDSVPQEENISYIDGLAIIQM